MLRQDNRLSHPGYFGEGSAAFSPDCATLAVASRSGIRLLDPKTRKEVNTLGRSSVYSLAFSPDGTTLAAGSRNGPVLLWDTETPGSVATLEGHTAEVRSLAFSLDGAALASGARDGTVLLWDLIRRPHALRSCRATARRASPARSFPARLVDEVRDENGDLLKGIPVTFTVIEGGGTLTSATAATDADGLAFTTLTFGRDPETVTATVADLDPVTFTAAARATPDFDGDGETGFSDFFLLADHFGDPARGKLFALAGEMIGLSDGPQLQQNAPNPFNSQTVISWFLLQPGPTRLEVFALTGQQVAVLHQGPKKAGVHFVHWNGRDDRGRPLASGVYLYRLVSPDGVLTRKLTLLR